MADDYGSMQTRIGSDLERTLMDVTFGARTWGDEIRAAINDAIKIYRSKSWWFNQQPTASDLTSLTTASNSYVNEYPGLIRLDSLRITIDGAKQVMDQIDFQTMEDRHDGTDDTGQPYEYCRYGGRLRLYPTPADAYLLTWSGTFKQATLSADGDTNAWMVDGELVIRSMAKLIMLRDYIKSYDDVPAVQQAVMEAEKALDREHAMRVSTRRLKARS
jgi:hypothetical protein